MDIEVRQPEETVDHAPVTLGRHRVARLHYDFAGLAVALLLLCLSLTPSLLPRAWGFQGVVSGIAAASGYGIGVVVGRLIRAFVRVRLSDAGLRIAWRTLYAVGALSWLVFLVLHIRWQDELNRLMRQDPPPLTSHLRMIALTAFMFVLLVGIWRGLRGIARRISDLLARWLSPRAARAIAVVLVTAVVVGILDGVVVQGLLNAADASFASINAAVEPGIPQPTEATRSGSPWSLATWDSLGAQGRAFVAGGPSADKIEQFTGQPAKKPVRVYIGLDSRKDTAAHADLAVAELERAGGFSREVLCVITATGTGWVDPELAHPLEYMFNGDTALVTIQYSYLPSWLSFLVDNQRAREAGRELFNRVYERWVQIPARERPRLLVAGESLGSTGSEAAFSGVADIRNRTDGALWVGPPNFNNLWRTFVEDREPGTLERLPVYDGGRTVRFAARPSDLARPDGPWPQPRVVYLQHASDPVVWWSPRLLIREPDWLREPRGDDVLPSMRWYPIVTFWQVTADLAQGLRTPAHHGHNYTGDIPAAWAAITEPPGWTPADTARLTALTGE